MADRVLVIGSGGREHALAWKLAQSPHLKQVLVAPGNAGTANDGKISNLDNDVEKMVGVELQRILEEIDYQDGLQYGGSTGCAC